MKKVIQITIHPELHDPIRRLARKRYRSVSGLIESLIIKELEKEQMLPFKLVETPTQEHAISDR